METQENSTHTKLFSSHFLWLLGFSLYAFSLCLWLPPYVASLYQFNKLETTWPSLIVLIGDLPLRKGSCSAGFITQKKKIIFLFLSAKYSNDFKSYFIEFPLLYVFISPYLLSFAPSFHHPPRSLRLLVNYIYGWPSFITGSDERSHKSVSSSDPNQPVLWSRR